jgi:predicted small lipoprotein YifL
MRRRDVVRTLGALVAAATVGACGKKGNLELPPEDDDEEVQ